MREQLERLMEEDDFSLYVPGHQDTGFSIIEKAGSKEDIEQTRPIGGHCSTESLDRQDEVVVAKGLDFSEFVAWGWFNDNHKQATAEVLGYPKLARLEKSRWWTEGNLITGFPPSDKIWELAKALKKSGAPRKLGFSIEGKVLQRDGGNRIVRAKVRNVAITNCPVNTDCSWDIMSKAMAPIEVVERAATFANNPVAEHRIDVADVEHIRKSTFTFNEAVEKISRLRPHLSKTTCARIVRFAMCR